MVWLPTASAEVVKLAWPPLSVPVPIELPPSKNVTVPVCVPAPGATAETVAVNVTNCPNTEEFCDELTNVVVLAFTTVTSAVEVLPVPALVSLTVTLLFAAPTAVPCTVRATVQVAPGARLAPNNDADEEPLAAAAVPLHVLFRLLGAATIRVPGVAGKASVNLVPVSVRFWLRLVTVKVRLVVAPKGIVALPKALAICGGRMIVRLAEAVLPLPASVESMVTLLLKTPSVVPCTFTKMVHVASGSEGFEKLIVPAPAVAVTTPPQPFTTLGVAATTKFVGNVSVKLAFIVTIFPLTMLNVSVLGVFTPAVAGLKLSVIDGGCSTMIGAVTVC